MKIRAVYFTLLVIIGINAFSLQPIFKLPVLVMHYWEHQHRSPSITIWDFMSMHYWGKDINDNDQQRDMQLPFKKIDFNLNVITLFFSIGIVFILKKIFIQIDHLAYYDDHLHSIHLGSLFRPPRVA